MTTATATKRAYTLREAAQLSSLCEKSVWNRIKAGALRARKMGRKTLILAEDLERFLQELPDAAAAVES